MTITRTRVESTQTTVDLQNLNSFITGYGFRKPHDFEEIHRARSFAADLIGPNIAEAKALAAAEKVSGISIIIFEEAGQITGVGAFLLLSMRGLEAIIDGTFDAVDPSFSHLSIGGRDIYATYAWGGAATTKASKRAVVSIASGMSDAFFNAVPSFARAITQDGERAMREHLAYLNFEGKENGLLWRPATCCVMQ